MTSLNKFGLGGELTAFKHLTVIKRGINPHFQFGFRWWQRLQLRTKNNFMTIRGGDKSFFH